MTRKDARKQAFILIFENAFKREPIAELIETAMDNGDYTEDEYCRQVVNAVADHAEEIDGFISQYAKGWKLDRLSKVAVSALRLAIAEMLYFEDIPESVSINEAVELVKTYATPEDASFVNGILGSFSRRAKEE